MSWIFVFEFLLRYGIHLVLLFFFFSSFGYCMWNLSMKKSIMWRQNSIKYTLRSHNFTVGNDAFMVKNIFGCKTNEMYNWRKFNEKCEDSHFRSLFCCCCCCWFLFVSFNLKLFGATFETRICFIIHTDTDLIFRPLRDITWYGVFLSLYFCWSISISFERVKQTYRNLI